MKTPFSNLPTYPPLAERLSDAQLSELEARAGELGLSVGLFGQPAAVAGGDGPAGHPGAEAGAATGLRHRLSVADGRPREQHSGGWSRKAPIAKSRCCADLPDGGMALLEDTLTHWRTNARLLQVM